MDKRYTHKKVNPDGTTTLWGENGYVGKLPAVKQPKNTLNAVTLPENIKQSASRLPYRKLVWGG